MRRGLTVYLISCISCEALAGRDSLSLQMLLLVVVMVVTRGASKSYHADNVSHICVWRGCIVTRRNVTSGAGQQQQQQQPGSRRGRAAVRKSGSVGGSRMMECDIDYPHGRYVEHITTWRKRGSDVRTTHTLRDMPRSCYYAVRIVCRKRHKKVKCPSVRPSVRLSGRLQSRRSTAAAAAGGRGQQISIDTCCCRAMCGPRKFSSDCNVVGLAYLLQPEIPRCDCVTRFQLCCSRDLRIDTPLSPLLKRGSCRHQISPTTHFQHTPCSRRLCLAIV